MSTSGATPNDGLEIDQINIGQVSISSDPPETPPKMREIPVIPQKYMPNNISDYSQFNLVNSKTAIDAIARRILLACVIFDFLAFAGYFAAAWQGVKIQSAELTIVFNAINYVATGCIGYLFGRTGENKIEKK